MSSEEGLLRAIQEDPDDDLPRQVLADWLDDQGDTGRAEFIRIQLELAGGNLDLAERNRLVDREREMLREHVGRWLGPFAVTDPQVFHYERGTARVQMHTASLLEQRTRPLAADWFRRGWVLDLTVQGDASDHSPLFEQPWLGQLHRLALQDIRLGQAGVLALTRCTALVRLSTLSLTNAGLGGSVVRLASCPGLGWLTGLALRDDTLGSEDITALDEGLPRLRRLNLNGCVLQRAHVEALLQLDRLEDLISLQLAGCRLTGELVELLVSSPRLAGLQELNLGRNPLHFRSGEAIAGSPNLANLVRLGLRNSGISGEGASALARSPHLDSLEVLDVWDCGLGRANLERLSKRFGRVLWMKLMEPTCWGRT
jgi:uncharacterized protein (TIGR02996 family)